MKDLKGNPSYCSTLGSYPFADSTESMIAENSDCLPTQYDIIEMRVKHGKTWACHSDESKPCKGALRAMRERGIECTVIDPELVTLDDDWTKLITYKG